MAAALAGIRVLEVGEGLALAYCGKLLAGLGADVVKLEPPGGDALRREGPFAGGRAHLEHSGLFLHLNTGKRSAVSGDLNAGLARLAPTADIILLGGTRPSAWPVRAETVAGRYPHLVVTSITPFGLDGPYANYLGTELIVYALSGYMMLTGDPAREPVKAYGELIGYQAGAHAALGTLAALFAREHTGLGQLVDVSAMEAGSFLLGGVDQAAYFYGQVARRNGTRLLGFPPEHSYPSTIRPCKDGFVHCHSNNRHLDLLAALIPHPRLLDPGLLHSMMAHADEVDAIMDEWLGSRTREEIVAEAQALRLPFTEVRTPGEVLADPHHRARGSFVTVDHPGAGPVVQPGAPIRMSATPWQMRPAPTLGQHDTEVLGGHPWPSRPSRGASPTAPPAKPLAGVRILDFTNAVAGPIATSILADLGADVVKVESPAGRPRRAAGTAPLRDGEDVPGYDRMMLFNELNHGKRAVSLDVARPEGRALFLRLAAHTDAVVQNFSPRVMGNLGLAYPQLRAANPSIILISMPAFGLDGPYRDRVSYGPGIDAMSGLSHLTGYPDGPPMKPGNFFCDQNAAVLSAFAALAALWYRRRTGEGQQAELAMIEGEMQVLGDAYIDFAWNGLERMRSGNAHPRMSPHGVYPCRGEDAWVAIAVQDEHQWRSLCALIRRPDMAADPRFASATGRREAATEVDAAISTWTSPREHREAQAALQAAGVPAGAVLTVLELLEDPHVRARDSFEYVEVPGVGPTPYPRLAFKLRGTPVPITRPAPRFAEHNEEIYRGLLGLGHEELAALERQGVVARQPLGKTAH